MEPVEVFAGTTWAWDVTVAGFSAADGWSLKYILTNASGAFDFEDDGTASGIDYLIEVAAAVTATFTAGDYTFQLFAINGADKRYISSGPLCVRPDISDGSTALDSRSHVKKTLDALDAVIENKASRDQQSHSIAGRSLARYAPADLIKWRAYYAALYRDELSSAQVASGRGNPNTIKTTFRRP